MITFFLAPSHRVVVSCIDQIKFSSTDGNLPFGLIIQDLYRPKCILHTHDVYSMAGMRRNFQVIHVTSPRPFSVLQTSDRLRFAYYELVERVKLECKVREGELIEYSLP